MTFMEFRIFIILTIILFHFQHKKKTTMRSGMIKTWFLLYGRKAWDLALSNTAWISENFIP